MSQRLALTPDVAEVLARLSSLLEEGDGPGMFLTARAGNAYCLRSLRTTGAFFSAVLKGRKRIHLNDLVLEVVPGQAVAIAPGACIDVENIPDPESGEYLAALHIFPEAVLNMARTLLGQDACAVVPMPDEAMCQTIALTSVVAELRHCTEAAQALAEPQFRYALLGLLIKLQACGITACLRQPRPRFADAISQLLLSERRREWRSIDVEEHFAVSGATLRRQLAAEGTSLRQLVAEARLGQALSLLQSTRLPVKTVAARAGYRSVSSFVRRFHERYGVEPSRVANSV